MTRAWNGIGIELCQEKMDFAEVVLEAAKKKQPLQPGEYRILGESFFFFFKWVYSDTFWFFSKPNQGGVVMK